MKKYRTIVADPPTGGLWHLDRCHTHGYCNCTVLRFDPTGEEVSASLRTRQRERKMVRIEQHHAAEQARHAALKERYE